MFLEYMRKIIFEMAMSLDGYIEGPNGELDWLIFEKNGAYTNEFLLDFDTIFYGRLAYEKFGITRVAGPLQTEAQREFYEALNGTRKYVFSRTAKHVLGNAMVIHDNLLTEVRRIRNEDGKNIWLCGGADIFSTFVELDLIDEYIFTIHPRILGSGKLLFQNIRKRLNLKLIHAQNLASGVVALHYIPGSEVDK
jgi:dihydrofolate reductase